MEQQTAKLRNKLLKNIKNDTGKSDGDVDFYTQRRETKSFDGKTPKRDNKETKAFVEEMEVKNNKSNGGDQRVL